MTKLLVVLLFVVMILCGAFTGYILFMIMHSEDNPLLHCVSMGGVFGLFSSFITLFYMKVNGIIKEKNLKLSLEVREDKLTELLNRNAFDNDIMLLTSKGPFSMIFIDIDDFRIYNNTYGHQVGDEVLTNCANIIRQNIRHSDSAYRYGGEEIVVLLNDCTKENAIKLADNIIKKVNSNDNAKYPHVTISAGVSTMPGDADTFEQLIRTSDFALLQAKSNGKNQVAVYGENNPVKKDKGTVLSS